MRCPNCDGTLSMNDFVDFDGEYVSFKCMVCYEEFKAEPIILQEEER